MEQIIDYLKKKYNPLSIILYGSYASGTNNLNSDFDALVISCDHEQFHDTSFVNGVQLDAFVYPASFFDGNYNCNDFIQIFDGKIIMDTEEKAKTLQNRVLSHLQNLPRKTNTEIKANVDWCIKMFERVKRCDTEGMFRWHWVLIDSLEIFCDLAQQPYWGPKKSLKWMEKNHPYAFTSYKSALNDLSIESLENRISCIRDMYCAIIKA